MSPGRISTTGATSGLRSPGTAQARSTPTTTNTSTSCPHRETCTSSCRASTRALPARTSTLLVDDIAAATAKATKLGATVVDDPGHVVLRSPGGVTFCVVPHSGESEPAGVVEESLPHAVDQICLDVPSAHFDVDVTFWGAFTGWTTSAAGRAEFVDLRPSGTMPLRILLRRLGDERAHRRRRSLGHLVRATPRRGHRQAPSRGRERGGTFRALECDA